MILLHLLVLISPAYGWFCEPRWTLFEKSCYKRFEEAPSAYINTCRTFGGVVLGNATGKEADFVKGIIVGGAMASGRGDFVCKKSALHNAACAARSRPSPRNELDCSGNPKWFGLNATKRCYSSQFSHQPLTWAQANTRCQNWFGGSLATLKSNEEFNHVMNVAHEGTYALTFDQPLVGYQKVGNAWKWVDGTQGGVTTFHGGLPDPSLNFNCAQLTVDITVQSDHQVAYNGIFGRMVGVPCNQRFQQYVCSTDYAAFIAKFTTTPKTTTTTMTPTTTVKQAYCPIRWFQHEEFCYRAFQVGARTYDCTRIGGENFEIPEDSTDEMFQKILGWIDTRSYPYYVCRRPVSYEPPTGNPTLPAPRNDFNCFFDGWVGFNKTGKCYTCINDLYNQLYIHEMRESCQEFGGSLVSVYDYPDDVDFLTQLGHLGVAAFGYELPTVDGDECGMMVISDYTYDHLAIPSLSIILEKACMLGSSYICEVDYDEVKRRHDESI